MAESRISLKKRMVRSFFLAFEKKEKTEEDIESELITTGMKYIQMKLPVEKITPEFEAKISSKIGHNVIQAKIREAVEKDLQIVTEIYNKSWLTSRTPFRPIEKGTLKTIFQDQDTIFLVARVYGIDGGFVILDLEGSNKEFGIIAGLGILPRFQRKGLGTVLGMAAWNHFKKLGVKELRCEVYKDNSISYNFISSLGFEEFGVKVYHSEDFNLE
ncbi:MAG: GNAT family N-acetyltransferase [Candidatus Lokiarchaeota archaeon]|nr:GNAT family N-acetyltransferase [Candidatus Lokiarchaeota archaeon]